MTETYTITKTNKIDIEAEVQDRVLVVRIMGRLDEDTNLGDILGLITDLQKKARIAKASFDMGLISEMNSCGTREWLLFMERMQNTIAYQFERINEIFIEAVNMVSNMLGKREVVIKTFDIPFFCSKCDKRISKTVTTPDMKMNAGKYTVPQFECERCGNFLELDALEEEYFNFLSRIKH